MLLRLFHLAQALGLAHVLVKALQDVEPVHVHHRLVILQLKEIKKFNPGIEVILLTGHASVDSAIDGMRLGAYDYIMKPCEIDALMEEINGAYEVKASRDDRIQKAELRKLVSRSPA